MNEQTTLNNSTYLTLIKVVSLAIPVVVAILLYMPTKMTFGNWVYMLPFLNAGINISTSILLILALWAVLRKKLELHRSLMSTAFILGAIFLLSYVTYHSSVDSVIFGDSNGDGTLSDSEKSTIGSTRTVYLIFLLSHILFSLVVVPLVLFAFYFSLTGQIEKHKKIVKFTYPIWLYVSITGVIVYFMIRTYY